MAIGSAAAAPIANRVERENPVAPGGTDLDLPPEEDDDAFGDDAIHDRYEDIKRGEIHLTELQKMTMPQLIRTAKRRASSSTPA